MFRKLVTGLPFSPALVGQLGFYAKRLKQEEVTRRLGLMFTALALIVQSLAVLSPPEPANATSASDFIRGGVTSVNDVLAAYDDTSKDFKKIMDYAGVTRAELKAMKDQPINSKEYGTGTGAWLTWGRSSRFSSAQGEVRHDINGTIVYSKPLWRYDTTDWTIPHGSTYPAFRGYSAKLGGVFAITKACGNLITTKLPVTPPPPPPAPIKITVCRPGVGVIIINKTDKQPTDLPADSDVCKPKPEPIAACSSLSEPRKIERTKFSVSASAVVRNGATISKFRFVVKKQNSSGQVVLTKDVPTTEAKAENIILEIKDAGTYYVQAIVITSLGEKTSADCAKTLTVLPPERCAVKPDILATDKECKPCPSNSDLWYKDVDCAEKVASEKQAINLTQNSQLASNVTANGGDRIQFTLTTYNVGKVDAHIEFKENISDVLEYATLHDNGGGAITDSNGIKYLSWGKVDLKPNEKVARTFTVKVLDTIPLTARGVSDPGSYDCIMTNTFGNTININMNCQAPKIVEKIVEQLPSTGPTENMLFAGIVGAIVVFYYARSRQLGAEVRLIRKDFNAGTI